MRRPLLILGSIVLLGGLFTVYWLMQPPMIRVAATGGGGVSPREMSANESGRAIGPGQGVWVSQYNAAGRLVGQFRAGEFQPRNDGTIHVIAPEARVLMADGSMIHMVADSGDVLVRDMPAAKASPLGESMPQMPSRGRMENVVVHMKDAAERPRLSMKVNNVAFDNDTFRIYTDAYTDPTGQRVPADRVKVEVRGEDVDFDGYGLTLRWDDKSQVVQMLEVAHGERVVLKRTPTGSTLESNETKPDAPDRLAARTQPREPDPLPTVAPTPQNPPIERSAPPRDEPATTVPVVPATSRPASSPAGKLVQPYRLKLLRDVRIARASETLATGDALTIDFAAESSAQRRAGDQNAARAPASVPTVAPLAAKEASPAAATPATATDDPHEAPSVTPVAPTPSTVPTIVLGTPASTMAASPVAPASADAAPIVVTWTGPLTMVPLTEPALGPLAEGQAVAQLAGKSVELRQAGALVTVGSALYRSADHGASLRPPEGASTITLADAGGRTLTTRAIDYDGATGRATLAGAGKLVVPASEETEGQAVTAAWSNGATIELAGMDDARTLGRIDCSGNVAVDHPRLSLRSQTLGLRFEPAGRPDNKQSALREIVAGGSVKAVTTGDDGTRTIESDSLSVTTKDAGDGKLSPDRFTATGKVHAHDDAQHLYADQVVATLASVDAKADRKAVGAQSQTAPSPAERSPAAQSAALKDLTASGNVRVVGKDDATASADRLHVTMTEDGEAVVELTGERGARVRSGTSEIVGPTITVAQRTGIASVIGAGSLKTTQGDGDKRRPISVTWADRATLDAVGNLVELTGDVKVTSTSPTGSVESSRSDRMRITLAEKVSPTTKKTTTKKAFNANPTTAPTGGFAVGGGAFGQKEPVEVALLGKVEVAMTDRVEGALARRFVMLAEDVRVDPKNERLTVPLPGRILYEDVRPAGAGAGGDDGRSRGATAVAWQKSLTVDRRADKANLTGDVVIRHVPLATDGDAVEVRATAIDADLTPAGAPTEAAAPAPGVRRVTATGPVSFVSGRQAFDADSLAYDAPTGVITARGSDRDPMRVLDDTGTMTGTATEVRYNLKTGRIEGIENFIATVRK